MTLTAKTGRSMPEPELAWHPAMDWHDLAAVWAQRDRAYRKFAAKPPTEGMIEVVREGRRREALLLADFDDRGTAYRAVTGWRP